MTLAGSHFCHGTSCGAGHAGEVPVIEADSHRNEHTITVPTPVAPQPITGDCGLCILTAAARMTLEKPRRKPNQIPMVRPKIKIMGMMMNRLIGFGVATDRPALQRQDLTSRLAMSIGLGKVGGFTLNSRVVARRKSGIRLPAMRIKPLDGADRWPSFTKLYQLKALSGGRELGEGERASRVPCSASRRTPSSHHNFPTGRLVGFGAARNLLHPARFVSLRVPSWFNSLVLSPVRPAKLIHIVHMDSPCPTSLEILSS